MKQPMQVTKATSPFGSKIMPVMTPGGTVVGGIEDAKTSRTQRMAATALRAEGPGGAMPPTPMAEGTTPYPGQPGRLPATRNAPAKLLTAPLALGAPTMRAEQAGLASTALSGGRIPMDPKRIGTPALPTATPTHPDAPGPRGDALSSPPAGGLMSGTMRGRSDRPSSG
jgi:hypothetical protein